MPVEVGKLFVFAATLRNDADVEAEYRAAHACISSEFAERIRATGVEREAIFIQRRRLVMLVELAPGITLTEAAAAARRDPVLAAWATTMRALLEAAEDGSEIGLRWEPMELVVDVSFEHAKA